MENRRVKIVADSAADLFELDGMEYSSVPLKIITASEEYVDDEKQNVSEMVDKLQEYKGKSTTACPSIGDWLEAFGDAEDVFCVTITSNLSGSYNSACQAAREYEQMNPGRRVHVVDTLSAGPEEKLIIEKMREFILSGMSFGDVGKAIAEYMKRTKLLFMLESMRNLANNGRVSPLVAKAVGLLGIRMVGRASEEGTLELLDKCRGERRALQTLVQRMKEMGHRGGSVRISHCCNENAAQELKELILKEFRSVKVEIYRCHALCSFYAEKGGLLMGFEIQGA